MKKITLLVAFSLTTLASVTALAAWDNGGITTQIDDVVVLQDGNFYINFADDICDSGYNDIGYVYKNITVNGVPWTKEGADMLLKVAISAKLSGSTVRVYANDSGSSWGCKVGALKIQ